MSTAFPDNSDKTKNTQTNYSQPQKPEAGKALPHQADDERPKIGKIVSEGKAVRRKTPLGTKLKNFIVGENANAVVDFLLFDVIVPAAKNTVADVVTQGIEQRLFGEVRSASRRTGQRPNSGGLSSNGPRVHYDRMSNNTSASRPAREHTPRRGGRHDIGQIVIPTRGEALEILEMMGAIINQFEVVTVAELMEMADMTAQYTDHRYGWTNLRDASVRRVHDGYLLDLPQPEQLER